MMSNINENSAAQNQSQNSATTSDGKPYDSSTNAVSKFVVPQINFKAPPFWRSNPELWFKEVEDQFITIPINNDAMQFQHVIAAIESADISKQIADIILNPPIVNMYNTLKSRIIDRFSESEDTRIKEILKDIKLGDQRPSDLLREIRDLSFGKFSDDVLKIYWFQKLPDQIKTVISTSSDTLNNLAIMADKINEVADSKNTDSASTNIPTIIEDSKIDVLETRILSLTKKVDALSRSRSRSCSTTKKMKRMMSLSKTRESSSQRQQSCWYHLVFGENALKCRNPCNFSSNSDN